MTALLFIAALTNVGDEIEEVACVSTKAPWQPWFIGQQANPAGGPPAWKPFNYVYHYFWGLEDVIAVYRQYRDFHLVGRAFVQKGSVHGAAGELQRVLAAEAAAGAGHDRDAALTDPGHGVLSGLVSTCSTTDSAAARNGGGSPPPCAATTAPLT